MLSPFASINRPRPTPSKVARSTILVKYSANGPSSVLVSVPCPLLKNPIGGSPKNVAGGSFVSKVPLKGTLPAFTAGLEIATVKNVAAIKLIVFIVFIVIGLLLVGCFRFVISFLVDNAQARGKSRQIFLWYRARVPRTVAASLWRGVTRAQSAVATTRTRWRFCSRLALSEALLTAHPPRR